MSDTHTKIVVGFALVLAGCGGSQQSQAPAKPGRSVAPVPLRELAVVAEDAYDKALAGDTAGVSADADRIAATWKSYRTGAQRARASAETIAAMDAAVAGLADALAAGAEPPALARAANQVSAPMDALFALYASSTPPAIYTLDYLGREVALDGLAHDETRAAHDLGALVARWEEVRVEVKNAGGTREAASFDRALVGFYAVIGAGDGPTIAVRANELHEGVHTLEAVFD